MLTHFDPLHERQQGASVVQNPPGGALDERDGHLHWHRRRAPNHSKSKRSDHVGEVAVVERMEGDVVVKGAPVRVKQHERHEEVLGPLRVHQTVALARRLHRLRSGPVCQIGGSDVRLALANLIGHVLLFIPVSAVVLIIVIVLLLRDVRPRRELRAVLRARPFREGDLLLAELRRGSSTLLRVTIEATRHLKL